MKHYPDYMPLIEQQITTQIINMALFQGYTISVYDGEETVLKLSTDHVAIKKEVAATDLTQLIFSKDEKTIGSVILIHGNGTDLIHDYSDNPDTELILRPAIDYAERRSLD